MATCPLCGAGILWKRRNGAPLAVDVHESTTGEGRYVERDGELLPVGKTAEVAAFVAHETSCSPRRSAR